MTMDPAEILMPEDAVDKISLELKRAIRKDRIVPVDKIAV